MHRLTTDEFNEQKDLIEMEKPLAHIRRQSLLNIPKMTQDQRQNIQERIFNNDGITEAKAN